MGNDKRNLLAPATHSRLSAYRAVRRWDPPRPASCAQFGMSVAAAVLVAVTAMAALGQTARPQFEVASVKPAGRPAPVSMRQLPGQVIANAPVRVLIQGAYHLQPFQIAGGPEWIGSESYVVDAKATGNPDRAQLLLMLQSLLEDRFQLRVHREPRVMPVYALVIARGGLKMPSPEDRSCPEDTDLLGPLAMPGGRIEIPGRGRVPAPKCGGLDVSLGSGGPLIRGDRVEMAEFVRVLWRVVGRPVIDRTGFSGRFDVRLKFLPDETTPGVPSPPPGAIPDNASPSMFSALRQLGLRLESTKAPVDVLVIDHVERPSDN